MSDRVYMTPNSPTPNKGMKFNPEVCNGCNSCVEVCPTDVMMPNPEKKQPPIVLYPRNAGFAGPASKSARGPGQSPWPTPSLRTSRSTGNEKIRVSSSGSA